MRYEEKRRSKETTVFDVRLIVLRYFYHGWTSIDRGSVEVGGIDRMKNKLENPFIAASITHMMVEIFLFMHPAILPILMREFNISIIEAGLVLTVPSFVRVSVNIPVGALADKINPRYLLMLSALLSGLGGVIVSASSNITFLIIGLCLLMMAVTMYHPPGLSIVSRLYSKGDLTRMVGIHGATGSIGQGLGIISLGFLVGSYGWRLCYLLWALVLFVWAMSLLKLVIIPPPSKPQELTDGKEEEESTSLGLSLFQMVTGKNFLLLILFMGISSLGNRGIFSFTTTYFVQTKGMTEDLATLIFGIGPLVGIFGSLIGGYLGEKAGERSYLTLASLGLAVFVFSMVYATWIPTIALFFLIYRWFFSSIWPASASLVGILSPEVSRGTAYSVYFSVAGLLGAVSPFITAALIEHLGFLSAFSFALILFLASSAIAQLIKT